MFMLSATWSVAREPPLFVDCVGDEMLREAGREVIYVPELIDAAREPNLHLFGS